MPSIWATLAASPWKPIADVGCAAPASVAMRHS